ncbi:hypothetical protein niasHT_023148 [Heterodera trifolii]|uniref:Uncharacterized protein n=1 Tax=Heterodera trifolii TaxID=157864 RepID=A0ABD2JDV2_9BILA
MAAQNIQNWQCTLMTANGGQCGKMRDGKKGLDIHQGRAHTAVERGCAFACVKVGWMRTNGKSTRLSREGALFVAETNVHGFNGGSSVSNRLVSKATAGALRHGWPPRGHTTKRAVFAKTKDFSNRTSSC